jgi:DNA-binding MarR family transcriptional regulator
LSNVSTTGCPDATDLGHLYISVHARIRRLVDDAMVASGVSLSRTIVLKLLAARGPVNQSAIALAPRSVTDLVDGLEREGLAERAENPADRRSRLVQITGSGSIALESALKVKHDLFAEIFAGLDPAARTELFRLLQTVRASLSPVQGEPDVR